MWLWWDLRLQRDFPGGSEDKASACISRDPDAALFFFFSSKHALNARPCAPCFVSVGTEFWNVVFGFSETQLSYSLAVCPRASCSPPSDSV